jgi:photosystem II stability/assembly factor-like uncharacterized protein
MDTILYVAADAVQGRGTESGVATLRSHDGRSWQQEAHGMKSWGVPKIATVPSEPNRVFAGTRGDGVWASEDFGKTWSKPCYGKRGPGKVRALTYDARDGGRLYAGCEPIDIFVSDDMGATWELLDGLWDLPWVAGVKYVNGIVEPHVRDVLLDPKDSRVIYAALQVGYIVKSTDGGKTWSLMEGAYDCDVHAMAIDPDDPDRILIATGGHDGHLGLVEGRSLYMTEDGGETWSPTAMEFDHDYSVPLTMHPRIPSILYSSLAKQNPSRWRSRPTGAESILVRTQDGGRTWERLEAGPGRSMTQFAESIVVDPERGASVYAACTNGDLLMSDDRGDSWATADVRLPGSTDVALVHA